MVENTSSVNLAFSVLPSTQESKIIITPDGILSFVIIADYPTSKFAVTLGYSGVRLDKIYTLTSLYDMYLLSFLCDSFSYF